MFYTNDYINFKRFIEIIRIINMPAHANIKLTLRSTYEMLH